MDFSVRVGDSLNISRWPDPKRIETVKVLDMEAWTDNGALGVRVIIDIDDERKSAPFFLLKQWVEWGKQ